MAKLKSGFKGERSIVLPGAIIEDFKELDLGKLLYITDIGFYPKAGFHYRSRKASDNHQYILIYCFLGEGWIEVDGKAHTIHPGHAVILPKGKAHSYMSSTKNPWSIYWIHFDGSMATHFSEGLEKPLPVHVEPNSRLSERIELFDDIFTILANGYSRPNLEYSVTVLFHFLGTLKFKNEFRSSSASYADRDHPVDQAIHYMRESLQRRLKLEEIAEYLGISASHFSLLFREKTGHSPIDYFNQLKVQAACHQLDTTQLQISQIASMVGFDDPLYFSRSFHKIMGYSPSDYKKRMKG